MVEDRLQHAYPRHIVAVSGVVTDPQGRVLLVKGDRRGWEPPGGQVELGEDLLEALQREIREESGVEIEAVRLVGVYSNLGRPERGLAEQVNFAFSCRWVAGEPRAGDECTAAGFFEADEARRMVRAPQQSAKLEDALAGTPEVGYRAYRTYPYEVRREGIAGKEGALAHGGADPVLISDPRVLAVLIEERGEPLVDLREYPVLTDAENPRVKSTAETRLHCRRGVAERLVAADRALPHGVRLLVVECHRPLATQERYWEADLADLRGKHPDWPEDRLAEVVVAMTSKTEPSYYKTKPGLVDVVRALLKARRG